MPELPEVEVVKKSLKKTINHLTFKKIEILNKYLRYQIDVKLMKKMVRSKILSIDRRSKYILLKLNNSYTIIIHLGMTGKIIISDSKNNKRRSSFYFNLYDDKPLHNHVIFQFNNDVKIIYNDVRKFGFIKVEKTKKLLQNSHFKKLGPEPLSKKFDSKYFINFTKKRKIGLKDLLMSQNFVAGLGNIYVNEAIFLSKINPRIKAYKISNKKIIDLIKNIKKLLKKAIEEGGSSIRDFNNADGQEGNFQQYFNVYGRKGELCRRVKCKGKIKIIRISNRSTFYCDKCQK